MKVNGWAIHSLLRTRKSQERDAYLAGSLNTSRLLSKRVWSSSDPKTRPCRMDFHPHWMHPGCEVHKWYKLHTCAEFNSIQHWQETDNQFFHEFLIIQLTDGSACRVERMGDGSRADAVRRIGCTAHDLIQWFSPEDHASRKWTHVSQEMITQVDFPRTFDLLDVLAVCFTIQHRCPGASRYTLQRYNCYFLCNTVLILLTRRVAEWETLVTDADWTTTTDNMIDELKRTSLMPEEQYALEFLSFGIPSLLDPNSSDPAGFLLEPLRSELKDQGLLNVVEETVGHLWYEHIKGFGFRGLDINDSVLDPVVKNPTHNSAEFSLHTLLKDADPERYPPFGIDLVSTQNAISRELLTLCSELSKEVATFLMSIYQMEELEHRPPLLLRLTASILGPLTCTIPVSLIARYVEQEMRGDNDNDGDGDNYHPFCSKFGGA